MPRPRCGASATIAQPRRTALGYRTFRCGPCRRVFNERTGLSARRDMAAAQRFFRRALNIGGPAPAQVTTDGHDADPRAIRATLGGRTPPRTSRDTNNRIAQDHRGITQRSYPVRWPGGCASAARFASAFEAQRHSFRTQGRSGEPLSLAARRQRFQARWVAVMTAMVAA